MYVHIHTHVASHKGSSTPDTTPQFSRLGICRCTMLCVMDCAGSAISLVYIHYMYVQLHTCMEEGKVCVCVFTLLKANEGVG